MFVGTTPPEIRLLLQDILKDRCGTNNEEIFVGCSGNFSTDKILAGMGFRVHSNDVSLYSKLIADIVLKKDTEVKVTNSDLANVFSQWPESRYKKLVQVMFAIKLSEFAPRKNDYQREFFDNCLIGAPGYYTNTLDKIERNKQLEFEIDGFFYGDFIEHLKNKRGRGIGVAFPPTYKGGYEKIFSFVEASFDYPRADYNLFDPKDSPAIFGDLLENDENIIYSDKEIEQLQRFEIAKAVLGAGRHSVYIYSSVRQTKPYYIERKRKPLTTQYQVVPFDYEFGPETKITLQICKVQDVNYYKAFYMANKVNYTEGGDFGLAFLADGLAFGFTSFSKQLSTDTHLFMQSDFVVTSCMPKLSKLLIMLCRSREMQKRILRFFKHYYRGVKTTVFTDKPVSMKYRGAFDLERRDKGKLIYCADFTDQTTQQIFDTWKKRFLK